MIADRLEGVEVGAGTYGIKSGGQMFAVTFHLPPVANVRLMSLSSNAVETLAAVIRGYTQVYRAEIDSNEAADMLGEIKRTQLQTPLEMIQTIWLIKGVTRAFTHQLVRYRIGTQFVQESMRFADKRNAAVLITPAIAGNPKARDVYIESSVDAFRTYADMIGAGVPIQDARGVLPHHVLTSVFLGCSLATLAHIYEQRTCCQAQTTAGEWGPVVEQMREQLPQELQRFVAPAWEKGPGCSFGAKFDRKCSWPEKFLASWKAMEEQISKE